MFKKTNLGRADCLNKAKRRKMKTKDLKELGLTDDQIDSAVITSNGNLYI